MRGLFIALVMMTIVIFLFSGLAVADPRDEAEQEVSELQQKVENSVERYNYSCYKLNETKARINENNAALEQAKGQLEVAKSRLNNRARALYMARRSSFLDVMVNATSFDEFLVGLEYSKKLASNDAELLSKVKEAEANLRSIQQQLAEQENEREAAMRDLQMNKEAVEQELAGAQGKLAGMEDQILQSMEARINEPVSTTTTTRSSPTKSNPLAPSKPPGEPNTGVVGVAYNQIGDPYVYGAAGPDQFDCSGLVMYCYAQSGVSLPHSSYAQRDCGTPVSISQLQAGDIVGFRGWGHVGIYVGGGEYIHAPYTGATVCVSSLSSRGDYSGAVRP